MTIPKISDQLKEVFEKAIPAYEAEILRTPKEEDYRFSCFGSGLCKRSYNVLRINISSEMRFVGSILGFGYYWAARPFFAEKEADMNELLQKRVDIMKLILENQ